VQTFLTNLGGGIAFGTLLWFAYGVLTRKIPATTPASWLMWAVLDSLLFITTLANHKPGWLPGAWVIGSASVTFALFVRGKWSWSYKETICASCAAIATGVWLHYGAFTGLIAGIFAMNIAGVPNFIDMCRKPVRESWPVWFFTAVACLFTLLGSDWSFEGSTLAATGMIVNGALAVIVLSKDERPVHARYDNK
jgi:hypothetical protein